MLKMTGIIRKVDDLGRVVIPSEVREILDIKRKDKLEVMLEADQIIFQKYHPNCFFCGNDRNVKQYRGKTICRDCIKELTSK
ncbi:MAG: AbrB/MazE/SpoVT family DNA-binding domain-containing protein [archaeon]